MFGRFEHSLDVKGRVILPVKLRSHFPEKGFITAYLEGCLALWTPEEFNKKSLLMKEQENKSPQERMLARLFAADAYELELDRQGRIAIPARLRKYAKLEGDALIHGAFDRVEIWNPTIWENLAAPAERLFIEGGIA